MKTNKNFLKKLTAGILGFVMTLGVGAAGYAGAASESRAATDTTMSVTTTSGTTWTATDGAKATFTGTSKSASSYYHVQKVEDITSTSFKIDFSQTVSVTVGIGSYGGKGKSTAQCWLTSGGSVISNKATATPNDTKSVDYTMTLNPTSGNNTVKDVVFNFGITSASTSVYIRLYKISISYKSAPTKTLSSIAVKTAPTKTTYTAGENFDPTGLVITKTYTDATTDDLAYAGHTGDFTFSPSLTTPLTALNTSVTITVGGKTTTQNITVNEPTPVSFEVVYDANAGSDTVNNMPDPYEGTEEYTIPADKVPTRNDYTFVEWNTDENGEGDSYDPGDVINEDTILYAIWAEEEAPLEPGTYVVELVPDDFGSYQSESTELVKTATEVGGTKTAQITFYHMQVMKNGGIQFHKGDGWIYNYTNLGKINSVDLGTYSKITTSYDSDYNGDFTYTDPSEGDFGYFQICNNTSNAGNSSKITINFTIKSNKTLDTIAVKTNPTKVTYNAGEKFDPSGLVIIANYVETGVASEDIEYNDTTKNKFSFDPDLNTALLKTVSSVKVTYGGKDANIPITVNSVHSITITGEDAVYAGESITLSATCIDGDNITEWAYADDTSSQLITLTGNGSTASVRGKKVGTAKVKAKCENGTWSEAFEIVVSSKPSGYMLVTDVSKLQDNDKLILGSTKSDGSYVAAGSFNTKYLKAEDATVTNDIISCDDANIITLKSLTGGWGLLTGDKYICRSGDDIKLSSTAETIWTISISNGLATIGTSDSTRNIQYNRSNPRFNTYPSQTDISIYRLTNNDSIKYDANGGKGTAIRDENIYEEGETFVVKSLSFTRDYYTSTGWNTAKDGTGTSYTPGQSYTFTENLTLYAQWQGDQYDITYKNGGGSAFDGTHGDDYPTKHTYGTTTQLDTPTKTGYTFGGWFDNSGCTGNPITSVGATDKTSDFTLYAKWTVVTNQINYLKTDGTAATGTWTGGKITSHTYGTETTLNPVTLSGYDLTGYYWDAELTDGPITKIPADYTTSGNINLYIGYTVHTHTITYYDADAESTTKPYSGSNGASLPTEFSYDEGVTLVPGVKENYAFKGWFTSNASTKAITEIKGGVADNDHDYVLFAKWQADSYTLSYEYLNSDGQWTEYNGYGVKRTHTYDSKTELSAPSGLSGYIFDGFYWDKEFTQEVTVIGGQDITEDKTIYMKTTVSEFEIEYHNVDLATEMPSGYPTTHTYGAATPLLSPNDKPDGTLKFDGWFYNEGLTNRVPGTLGNQAIEATKAGQDGKVTLYAKWSPVDYEITYLDKNGVEFSGSHQSGYAKIHTYGEETTLDTPTKKGYNFTGYHRDSACETPVVTSIPASESPGAISLYATWSAQEYSITYVGAETEYTLAADTPMTHTYDSVTTLKNPTKPGFSFVGWYKTSACTGTAVTTLGATEYTGDITLYAKFEFGAQDALNNVKTDIGMAYKYTDNGSGLTSRWVQYDGTQEIKNGTKIAIVSKYVNSTTEEEIYYSMNLSKNSSNNMVLNANVVDLSNLSFSDTSTWTVDGLTTENKFALSSKYGGSSYYLSLAAGGTGVSFVGSKPTSLISINNTTKNNVKYYGISSNSSRMTFYENVGGLFKHYATSNIGATNYASGTYIYVYEEAKRYTDVDFRLKLQYNGLKTFVDSYEESFTADYGLRVTYNGKELYFSAKNKAIYQANGTKVSDLPYLGDANTGYFVLQLNDVINDLSKAETVFTIAPYVTDCYGARHVSEVETAYSVITLIERYANDPLTKNAESVIKLAAVFGIEIK